MAAPQARLALAAVAQAPPRQRPMHPVTWHSVDLRTGRRGAPVVTRGLGQVSRILSEATETTLEVAIQVNGEQVPDWEPSTTPGLVMLVAVDQNDRPIWGGMVYRRLSTRDSWVTLSLVTLEAYLDRRYINADTTFTDADQVSEIAAGVINTTLTNGVEFTVDAPYSNWRRDREYLVDDDKTVLSILQELEEIDEGIEFTVDLEWTDETATVLDRIIRVRNRLGTAYLGSFGVATDHPAAVFHMPGSVIDFSYVEDYSSEHGANAVVAVSSGEGEGRPESSRWIAAGVVTGYGGSWPIYERRFTPSTSISEIDTLNAHAYAELRKTWDGMRELTLEANLDTAPRVNEDWWLGDDVGVALTGARFPERVTSEGERLPGYFATVRAIGWEIDFDARTLKPRLLEAHEVEVEAL